MKCDSVVKQLSLYVDDMLDADRADEISLHLEGCAGCRREFVRTSTLTRKLGRLGEIPAPPYLRHLVEFRLQNSVEARWTTSLRRMLEYRWSRIRTTEADWFLTRILGTMATCVLFFVILSAAMTPMYTDSQPSSDRSLPAQSVGLQLGMNVLKNLGLMPLEAQKKPISPSEAKINDLYLLNFSQTASRSAQDDTFSVVTVVDRSGSAKIRNVLEYPADTTLLADFNSMISSARCRPASQNGRAVESHLVMTFSKISVYD